MAKNHQNWGWACEMVIAVEVVTAQGEQLLCNETQNEELYWAARGSGPRMYEWVVSLDFANGHVLKSSLPS